MEQDAFWEERFEILAEYNRECSRGIVHTKEWDDKMKNLQIEFDKKVEETYLH